MSIARLARKNIIALFVILSVLFPFALPVVSEHFVTEPCHENEWLLNGFDSRSNISELDTDLHKGGELNITQLEDGLLWTYSVVQTEPWGGFQSVKFTPLTSAQPSFDLTECSHLNLDYIIREKQSTPSRAHFRITLGEASNCIEDETEVQNLLQARCNDYSNLEVYYSFHQILDQQPSEKWKTISLPLQGGTSSALPLWMSGWSGQTGNAKFEPSMVRGVLFEISIDASGEIGSRTQGEIVIGELTCVGKQSLPRIFSVADSTTLTETTMGDSSSAVAASTSNILIVLRDPDTNPFKVLSQNHTYIHLRNDSNIMNRPWTSFNISNTSPVHAESVSGTSSYFSWHNKAQVVLGAVLSVPVGTNFTLWMRDLNSTVASLFSVTTSDVVPVASKLKTTQGILSIAEYSETGELFIQVYLDPSIPLIGSRTGDEAQLDFEHIKQFGFELEVNFTLMEQSTMSNPQVGVISPFTTCMNQSSTASTGEEAYAGCVFDKAVDLVSINPLDVNDLGSNNFRLPFINTADACCPSLLSMEGYNFGYSNTISRDCVLMKSLFEPDHFQVAPRQLNKDVGLGVVSEKTVVWVRREPDLACTSPLFSEVASGQCDCPTVPLDGGEIGIAMDCSNRNLNVLPYIDSYTATRVVSMDFSGNNIAFVSAKMMFPQIATQSQTTFFPVLQRINLSGNGLQFFDVTIPSQMPKLTELLLIDEINYEVDVSIGSLLSRNFREVNRTSLSSICCEATVPSTQVLQSYIPGSIAAAAVAVGEDNSNVGLEFCGLESVVVQGRDCFLEEYVYYSDDSNIMNIYRDDELGAFASSYSACCNFCSISRDCLYFVFDSRITNAETRCILKANNDGRLLQTEEDHLNSAGGPGYISGSPPITRYRIGESQIVFESRSFQKVETGTELAVLDYENNFKDSFHIRAASKPYRGMIRVAPIVASMSTFPALAKQISEMMVFNPPEVWIERDSWNTSRRIEVSMNDSSVTLLRSKFEAAFASGSYSIEIIWQVDSCDTSFMFVSQNEQFVQLINILPPEPIDEMAQAFLYGGLGLSILCFLLLSYYRRSLQNARKAFASVVFQEVVLHALGTLFEIADILTDFLSLRQVWSIRAKIPTVAIVNAVVFTVGLQIALITFYERYKYSKKLSSVMPVAGDDTSEWKTRAAFLHHKITLDCKSRVLMVIVGLFEDLPMIILNTYVLGIGVVETGYLQILLSYLLSGIMLGYKVTTLRRIKDSTQTLEELRSMEHYAETVMQHLGKNKKQGSVRASMLEQALIIPEDRKRNSMEWAQVDMSKMNMGTIFGVWAREQLSQIQEVVYEVAEEKD